MEIFRSNINNSSNNVVGENVLLPYGIVRKMNYIFS